MSERILYGMPARCGKSLSSHYCPVCKTPLVRVEETVFYCPNCHKKVKALMMGGVGPDD